MSNIGIAFKYAFKDFGRQKVRTTIAIIGVLISVGLLTIVLILSDTIAVTFVEYMSIDAGNQDMAITVRHYNGEPEDRSSYYLYNPLVNTIEANFDEIENLFPRMEVWGRVNASKGFYTPELSNERVSVFLSGIDFNLESSAGFGAFVYPQTNRLLNLTSLPSYHCAIYYEFNEDIKYAVNDTITITTSLWHGNVSIGRTVDLTVASIFDFQLKWPIRYTNRPLIVVDINTLHSIFGNETFYGRCNQLILTIKGSANIYDSRNLEGTANSIKNLAGMIQKEIGLNEYNIEMPKLEVLEFSQFLSIGITIIFVFVSMISMLISGVLINGILKTSVEERIREFGIFRTLGATKKYSVLIVIIQGLLLSNIGTILGIIGAFFLTRFLIVPFVGNMVATSIPGLVGNIVFSASFFSLIISYVIGVSVGLIVSISPAIKVSKLQLIESIHPYRHEDTLYHLQKKSSINYKLIIVGVILAFNGGFVLFIVPRILLSADISLIAGILIALLIVFLIGTSLAGLGLMPIILRFFIQVFRLISNKLYHVYKIFIFRYARRNTSTIIIFVFTFSFVIFTAGAFQFLGDQVVVGSTLNYGSDLVLETQGWAEPEENGGGGPGFFSNEGNIGLLNEEYTVNPNRIFTSEFKEELLKIEGVEKVATVIASPYHLEQIYSEVGREYIVEIGDYAGLSTLEISLIGIDEEYPSTIDTKYMEFTKGDMINSFNQIFLEQDNYTCIISEGISVNMDLTLNDIIRMVVTKGDEQRLYAFRIVGVAAIMPGFSSEFARSSGSAFMGGVMISQEAYIEIMDIPPIPYLDKLFIKAITSHPDIINDVEIQINEQYSRYYDYELTNLYRETTQGTSYFSIIDIFFTVTLASTIVICLFGLLSSSYSTYIERKKEIGIIRTLGLKGREIVKLFTVESLIIMISAGTVGMIIGWLTGLLLASSINTLSDLPNVPKFPFVNAIIVFTVSIIFTIIGMSILLSKVRKKKIVDIYRETM